MKKNLIFLMTLTFTVQTLAATQYMPNPKYFYQHIEKGISLMNSNESFEFIKEPLLLNFSTKADRLYFQQSFGASTMPKRVKVVLTNKNDIVLSSESWKELTISKITPSSFIINSHTINLNEKVSLETVVQQIHDVLISKAKKTSLFQVLIPEVRAQALAFSIAAAFFILYLVTDSQASRSEVNARLTKAIQQCENRDSNIPFEKSELNISIGKLIKDQIIQSENTPENLKSCNDWAKVYSDLADKSIFINQKDLTQFCNQGKRLTNCANEYKNNISPKIKDAGAKPAGSQSQ